jgi:23S rRNA pseudouridine1911/1915/1917 synthase
MEQWNLTITPPVADKTLDDFIALFHVGEKKKNRLKLENLVKVNDALVPLSTVLRTGDIVSFDLTPFEKLDFLPDNARIALLHEDDWILIFDKPSGLIVYPETKIETGTLVNRIAQFYVHRGWDRQVRYLHRLDRETTGCFAVAKNVLTHSYFSELWDHRQITRTYLALVSGPMEQPSGRISASIGRDRHVQNKFRISPTGEAATTEYEVIKNYEDYALVRLRLITGKTHQIRVHMASIGHPLLGDLTYGGSDKRLSRTALHSESITFPNPLKNTTQTVRAPLPADMAALVGTRQP